VEAVRFTGVAPTVSGFASGTDARQLIVTATGGPLVLANQNTGSTAANRIITGTGGDVTIPNGGGAVLVYDVTTLRWRVVSDALPAGTTNAVLQRSDTGPPFFAALTLDQIAAAYTVSLALTGAALVEAGQTVATPAFTASYARTPAAAVLTDTVPTTPQNVIGTPTSFSSTGTFTKSYGQSVTFTLTANETGGPSKTSSAAISWGQKEFWGNAVPGTPNAAFIAALPSSALTLSRARTFTSTAGATERLYFACRSAYGTPTFTVGGFAGGFHLAAGAVAVTNGQGVTENYDLWESDFPGLGATTVVVT
jgi:hypothetical protein